MNNVFTAEFSYLKNNFIDCINNFKYSGTLIGDENRNIVKHFDINGLKVNFKSFKQPNPFNRLVYTYFRKTKARRSFEYANLLISKNFNTPTPIAYFEYNTFLGLTSSYYISEHLENTFTLREVMRSTFFKDREELIKKYTLIMYQLHENGIEFIDNNSANFLIKLIENQYSFFIVDLNRMNFYHKMKISKRLKNISKITSDLEIIKIISTEYALLSGLKQEYCLKRIINASKKQQYKRALKNKLKFYKSFRLYKSKITI